MTKSNQTEGAGVAIAPAAVLASALLKGAGIWIHGQSEVLCTIEGVMADWIDRRREVFDIWSRSLEKICRCREPVDFIRVQQDWLCDAFRLTACDIRVLAGDSAASTKKGVAEVDKTVGRLADDIRKMGTGKPETGENQPIERAAVD